jgi:hypothetical protein
MDAHDAAAGGGEVEVVRVCGGMGHGGSWWIETKDGRRIVAAHPSHKYTGVARVGHPDIVVN